MKIELFVFLVEASQFAKFHEKSPNITNSILTEV